MSASVIVSVFDQATGERLTSPEVFLYLKGVPGETRAAFDGDRFFFQGLAEGDYSLAIYEPRHVTKYERVTVADSDAKALEVHLTPGAFLSGRILDEYGQPPERSSFTLFREGERRGKPGYINDSGDHKVAEDGTFCSPPLPSARYFLGVKGFLPKLSQPALSVVDRWFDFLYPNAWQIADATGFDLVASEQLSDLEIRIPHPVRYAVRGRIIGKLPEPPHHVSVMFSRDIGSIDRLGSGGSRVQADSTFEDRVLPGRYFVEVCEFSQLEPDGRTRLICRLGKTSVNVVDTDVNDVEISVSPDDLQQAGEM